MLPECLTGSYIKHKHAKDVCYYVSKVARLNGDIKYNLVIYNMGFEKSWRIDTCKVDNIDLSNFVYYSDDAVECLRYADWKEIK